MLLLTFALSAPFLLCVRHNLFGVIQLLPVTYIKLRVHNEIQTECFS